jgi:hypothetical protein
MQHGSTLYNLGLSYYAHGTIKQGRKVQAYFYKLCKPATSEQIQELRKSYPHVSTGYGYNQYAPEQRASVLIFPSKAEIKRLGV